MLLLGGICSCIIVGNKVDVFGSEYLSPYIEYWFDRIQAKIVAFLSFIGFDYH